MYTAQSVKELTVTALKAAAAGYSIPNSSKIKKSNRTQFEAQILEAQEAITRRRKLVMHLTAFRVSSGFAAFSASVSEAQRVDDAVADIQQHIAAQELTDFRTERDRHVVGQKVDAAARRFDAAPAPAREPVGLADVFAMVMIAILAVAEIYVELGAIAVAAGRWVRAWADNRYDLDFPTFPRQLAYRAVPAPVAVSV